MAKQPEPRPEAEFCLRKNYRPNRPGICPQQVQGASLVALLDERHKKGGNPAALDSITRKINGYPRKSMATIRQRVGSGDDV